MLTDEIIIKNLCKNYGSIPAVSNVDFNCKKGTLTCILGPNGAGKSTLLKALCGVHYVTQGELDVCGFSNPTDIRKIVGFVPELPSMDLDFTVEETLWLKGSLFGVERKQLKSNVFDVLKKCDLLQVRGTKLSKLSKGYLQRTAIAAALVYPCKVLVLDEFSEGLDPNQIKSMEKLLINLSREKIVIVSTHHISEAESLGGNVYIMNGGTVVAGGSLSQILQSTGTLSLEDAFFSLTGEVNESSI